MSTTETFKHSSEYDNSDNIAEVNRLYESDESEKDYDRIAELRESLEEEIDVFINDIEANDLWDESEEDDNNYGWHDVVITNGHRSIEYGFCSSGERECRHNDFENQLYLMLIESHKSDLSAEISRSNNA